MAPNRTQVQLYYLGGLGDGLEKARPVLVRSRGRTFAIPPVGEFLLVDSFQADDLTKRHRITGEGGDLFDVFTRDAKLAKRVKEGRVVRPTEAKTSFTADELRQMLAKAEAAEADDGEDETPKTPKSKKKAATLEEPAPDGSQNGSGTPPTDPDNLDDLINPNTGDNKDAK